jgi:hypothetical protein
MCPVLVYVTGQPSATVLSALTGAAVVVNRLDAFAIVRSMDTIQTIRVKVNQWVVAGIYVEIPALRVPGMLC